mmetsp:Transcript_19464/g.21773  ORF Transcript_19464/g.21773 Transcript_19464/m.21773 type:complete len:151 (-) Transcript_19464:59-511(-)|eukprot:CAMPEP_0205808450 /NCGR_PEP_ID=MMETSP0205-20121125/12396_1 /ASSEMBLY_ACC=CAM_ASM_000278 /TAXON_ID=36767 /ORGANISM="Euplotes focardii, Strain TN1" /LENGTH=150 /DNA_ID=CAMNT_0053084125 /DNA_START=25 /DNA_END=477 /DNA_ORIENTATION=+
MKSIFICLLVALLSIAVASRKIEFHFSSLNDGTFEAVTCQVGDEIEVHLAENPTTGFTWMIPEEKEGFNSIWSVKDTSYEAAPKGGNQVGSGGMRKISINCDYAGSEHLTLVYGKPQLYDRAMREWKEVGTFDALTMGGKAVQLKITSIR